VAAWTHRPPSLAGRAALQDLASPSPDSNSRQLVELVTSRLAGWPRSPPELLQSALGAESGLAAPELAPWAARMALAGCGAAAKTTSSAAGRGGGGGIAVVVCSVEAVGALAGSIRRRWEHWQKQQVQAWQHFQQKQQQVRLRQQVQE
jgi:hypothetical protein